MSSSVPLALLAPSHISCLRQAYPWPYPWPHLFGVLQTDGAGFPARDCPLHNGCGQGRPPDIPLPIALHGAPVRGVLSLQLLEGDCRGTKPGSCLQPTRAHGRSKRKGIPGAHSIPHGSRSSPGSAAFPPHSASRVGLMWGRWAKGDPPPLPPYVTLKSHT